MCQQNKEINQLKINAMIKNIDNKIKVLEENYNNSDSEMTFSEYVRRESENDPNFFSWLYDETSGNEIPEQEVIDSDLEELIAKL